MIADNANDPIEALTFDLHGETFALEAGLVREVLDLLPETAVPGAPPCRVVLQSSPWRPSIASYKSLDYDT